MGFMKMKTNKQKQNKTKQQQKKHKDIQAEETGYVKPESLDIEKEYNHMTVSKRN